jgi:hypothetical protein
LSASDFSTSKVLARFEGGAVLTAERDGKFFVIQDESTMAGFLSDEDAEGIDFVKVLEFDTNAERDAHIAMRGWDKKATRTPTRKEHR